MLVVSNSDQVAICMTIFSLYTRITDDKQYTVYDRNKTAQNDEQWKNSSPFLT